MRQLATRRSDLEMVSARLRVVAPVEADGLHFEVLGHFVVQDQRPSGEPRTAISAGSQRCQWSRPLVGRVVRYLLVHRSTSVCEERLFEAFWPERDPESARRSLAVALSLARKDLRLDAGGGATILSEERRHQLVLGPDDRVDADEFLHAAAALLRPGHHMTIRQLEHAAALWSGEPLPQERHSDWAADWRDDLTRTFGAVLAALSDAYGRDGRTEDAIRAARSRAELDPLDESAQRALMTSYARAGRRAPALAQFLKCRQLLIETVGIEPCEITRDLHCRILDGVAV